MFIFNIHFIYHVLIKAKLILMPLTHINLFSFVCVSGVGALVKIAGDSFTSHSIILPSRGRLAFLFVLLLTAKYSSFCAFTSVV